MQRLRPGEPAGSDSFLDMGATYTLVTPTAAREVGLVLSGRKMPVVLADGRRAKLPFGTALVRIDGRETGAIVLVGECDEPLIGVETLEGLGMAVDPQSRKLVPTRPYAARLGGYRRSR